MQYCIKAVPSDDNFQMESLLNEMSSLGWELYTMHEVEADEGYNYNCIFVKEYQEEQQDDNDENLFGGVVPFVSLARNDADFVPQGQYWRGGVWLPTAYATLRGLTNYGYHKEDGQNADENVIDGIDFNI